MYHIRNLLNIQALPSILWRDPYHLISGVQRYTFEGRISCGLDWFHRSPQFTAYNVLIFVTGFIAPLTVMTICHFLIFYAVSMSGDHHLLYGCVVNWRGFTLGQCLMADVCLVVHRLMKFIHITAMLFSGSWKSNKRRIRKVCSHCLVITWAKSVHTQLMGVSIISQVFQAMHWVKAYDQLVSVSHGWDAWTNGNVAMQT